MKKINATNDNITIEQFTPVYHRDNGKGSVVSVTFRKDNNLIMCYFPRVKEHEWITERDLRSGMGDITLTKEPPQVNEGAQPDSLQQMLEGLFSPR